MFKAYLLGILAVCAMPPSAAAQSWADAYKAGDYAKAVALLQQIVIKQHQEAMATDPDPAPTRHLAALYAHGSGVERDPVVACALAQLSDMALRQVPVRVSNLGEASAYRSTIVALHVLHAWIRVVH